MANLVQVAEELEYVPKDQLIEYSQNPDSRYPQYLVLSEIQRRTQMERMYNAQEASMNKPTTTVAEEVVSDFAQPQGLGGMNVNGSANADAFSPQAGMPAAPMQMPATPMQMASSGGRTGYYPGGTFDAMNQSMQASRSGREALLSSLDIDPRTMTGNQIQQSMLGLGVGSSRQRGIRNNNPLNIKYNPNNDWLGQVGSDDDGFAIFKDIDYGYRAGNQLLQTYGEDHGIDTISEVINRFAPAADDNDTDSYSDFVSSRMGIGADEKLDMSDPALRKELTTIMASFETPDAVIDESSSITDKDLGLRGASAYDKAHPKEEGWGEWLKRKAIDRYTDEGEGLGAVDWSNVLWDASLAIPGAGALGLGARTARLAANAARAKWGTGAIQQGLRNLPSRATRTVDPRRSILTTKPNPKAVRGEGFVMSGGKYGPQRIPSATRISLTGAGLFGAKSLHDFATKDEGEKLTEIHPTYKKRIVDKVGELTQDPKSGLGGKMKSYLDQVDGLDIAKLGGIVMGARNMSELGQGITALASDIQTRRKDEKTEDRLAALSDLQGGLYEEQTKQIKAEIAAMPADRLDALLKKYGDYAEEINKGMIDISDEAKNSFWSQYRQLLDSAAEKEGYKFKSQAESDEEALDIVNITG